MNITRQLFNEAESLYISIPDEDRANAHEHFIQHGLAHDYHEAVELMDVIEENAFVDESLKCDEEEDLYYGF